MTQGLGVNLEKSFYYAGFNVASVECKMTLETSQRKVVGRTVVIVLGLICVVLAAGLVGVLAVYLTGSTSASEINRLKAENTALKGNMTALTNQYATLQNSLSQANANVESLTADNNDLQDYAASLLNVLNLNVSAAIVPNQAGQIEAGENLTVFNDFIDYAGYITVQVTSDSNSTFVQVIFSFGGFNFDNTVVVGESGTAAFPVLPGSVTVNVGNTELTDAVNATVTATYIY